MAWLRTFKCYLLAIVGSYSFRHTAGLLIHQYQFLPANLVHLSMFQHSNIFPCTVYCKQCDWINDVSPNVVTYATIIKMEVIGK